jgi:hypothetical protein
LFAQHKHGAANEMQRQGLAFQPARQLQLRTLVPRGLAGSGLNRAVQFEPPFGVAVRQPAALNLNTADKRRLLALFGLQLFDDRSCDRALLRALVQLALGVSR